MTNSTTALTVRVDQSLMLRLRAVARTTAQSTEQLAREAIRALLEQHEAALRAIETGMADADAGRLTDHTAVAEWLESWGTERELPPPRCG